ncbi:hypothetical protein ACLB2K_011855 [Fragaria x ananassa]
MRGCSCLVGGGSLDRSRRVVILHVIDRGGRRNRLVIDIGDAAADLRHLHLVGPDAVALTNHLTAGNNKRMGVVIHYRATTSFSTGKSIVPKAITLEAICVQAFASAESIQNGSIGPEEVWRYLKLFGYLNQTVQTEDYDIKALESALKLSQQTYHLNVTGKLDLETINLITTPRCGFPDYKLVNGSQSRRVQIGSYNRIISFSNLESQNGHECGYWDLQICSIYLHMF